MTAKTKKENKVLRLEEAIGAYVKPGLTLHLAAGLGGPGAATCEIIRQFYNAAPNFKLIQSTVTGHAINLVHCNLLSKLFFSACIEISVSAHPSKVIQKAFAERKVEFENWSLLSLQQRLMAGAMGIDFIPTRSILGSTMASENRMSFKEIDDPFDKGKTVGILKCLNPDLSIVHGCAADDIGNTILAVPYGDDIWGALGSKGGVIVTVEKVVSSDVIRKYSALVKIPSSHVIAVCPVPMGIHPFSFTSPAEDVAESYEADEDFLRDLHIASEDSQRLDDWLEEWVLGCEDHERFLNKLGTRRISKLKRRALEKISIKKPGDAPSDFSEGYSENEMLLIAASREIVDSVIKSNHKTMLVGAGSRGIAATVAYYELIKMGYEIDLITGNGQIGYLPQPGESSAQTVAALKSSKMLTDTITTHGVFVGGKNSRCLSVLGAGQVDRHGNINSSRTSDGEFLVGTGGANDAVNAREVILILNQSKKRFVETLPYVTARGDRVSKVISTMGVFIKKPGKSELILKACFPEQKTRSLEEMIKKIENNCGWALEKDDDLTMIPEPGREELNLLRFLFSSETKG
ncbi:MAG: hypothetical protein JW882_13230 [Deltaproteobacteria bacterium]|nr:hypothetical protein [Deltaproteobacteria bacterium]